MVPSAGSKLVKPGFGGLDSGPIQNNPVSTKRQRQIFGDLQENYGFMVRLIIEVGTSPLVLDRGFPLSGFICHYDRVGLDPTKKHCK